MLEALKKSSRLITANNLRTNKPGEFCIGGFESSLEYLRAQVDPRFRTIREIVWINSPRSGVEPSKCHIEIVQCGQACTHVLRLKERRISLQAAE